MQTALPILMYHHVSPSPGLVTVSPATFANQMQSLFEAGWKTLGAKDLESFFRGKPLPKKSVLITFDDGYLDNLVYAHPILAKFGQKALLFVVTSWLGDGPIRSGNNNCPDHGECKRRIASGNADDVILRWSEVEFMRNDGTFEIHSHTHTHTRWDKQLPDSDARLEAMRSELMRSKTALNSRLGLGATHLCWPQGYYQPEYVELAAELGYRWMYTTEEGTNLIDHDGFHLARVVVKDKKGGWLLRRLSIYASPLRARYYQKLKTVLR